MLLYIAFQMALSIPAGLFLHYMIENWTDGKFSPMVGKCFFSSIVVTFIVSAFGYFSFGQLKDIDTWYLVLFASVPAHWILLSFLIGVLVRRPDDSMLNPIRALMPSLPASIFAMLPSWGIALLFGVLGLEGNFLPSS